MRRGNRADEKAQNRLPGGPKSSSVPRPDRPDSTRILQSFETRVGSGDSGARVGPATETGAPGVRDASLNGAAGKYHGSSRSPFRAPSLFRTHFQFAAPFLSSMLSMSFSPALLVADAGRR